MSHNWRKYRGCKCYECGKEAPHCSCKPIQWSWQGYPMQLQEKWNGGKRGRSTNRYRPSREVVKEAARLYREGYRQVSRKYRELSIGGYFGTKKISISRKMMVAFRRLDMKMTYLAIAARREARREERRKNGSEKSA